jgi:hypothetical protein
MLKVLRIIFLALFLLACLGVGVMLVVRGAHNKSNSIVLDGKVVDKKLDRYISGDIRRYVHYRLEFKLEGKEERIAISYFSRKEAYSDSTIYLVDTGKIYRFYLDKTYPTSDGINNGINRIEFNNKEIFKKNNIELYIGIFFILLSIGLAFCAVKFGKWKQV